MQKILIDTDPGQDIDDLLALLFALRRPELEILGITTVTWPSPDRARLVKRLLRYEGRTEIPVAAGREFPHALPPVERTRLQDPARAMNHGAFAEPADPRDAPGDLSATELIIRTIEAHPGEVALCCLAPLSNIADALQQRPDLAAKIPYIALMGGEVAEARRENNIAFDCEASAHVFAAGIPIYMGTWSITRQFCLTQADWEAFRASSQPVCQALASAMDLWQPAQSWKPAPVMYDVFPLIWAFHRKLYTLEEMPIHIHTTPGEQRGHTLIQPGAPLVHVTTGIQAEEVRRLYLETVLGPG